MLRNQLMRVQRRGQRGRRSSKNMLHQKPIGFVPNPWDTPQGVAEKTQLPQKHPETEKKAK